MNKEPSEFKFELDYGSLVKFTTFIGFCFGVCSIPLVILFNVGKPEVDAADWVIGTLFILIGTPIVGALNGALFGLLGYPMYKWLTNRVGYSYKGKVYFNESE